MKKILTLSSIIILTLALSACSNKNSDKISNPITDPGGYTQDMIDLNKNMQNNIQDSTDQENQGLSETPGEDNKNNNNNMQLSQKYSAAVMKTNYGEIKVKLLADLAPKTVENFLKLSDGNFYDGVKFHRVIKGFMIQAGDPLSKDETIKNRWGTGGPGYEFEDELKGTEKYPQGTLAMANAGPDTNGSQFFIVTASPAATLPPNYTVFGKVVSGLDVAIQIENVETDSNDRPTKNVVIESVENLEK